MTIELSILQSLRLARTGTVQIGILPLAVSKHVNSPIGFCYVSAETLRHIKSKHPEIDDIEMLCITDMLRHGEWFADRKNAACVIYVHPETMRLYKSAIKSAKVDSFEVYLSTFHRTDMTQINSIRKRFPRIV